MGAEEAQLPSKLALSMLEWLFLAADFVVQPAIAIPAVALGFYTQRGAPHLPGLPFAPGHKNAVLLPLYM